MVGNKRQLTRDILVRRLWTLNPVSELMRITSSQQASGLELSGVLWVYNMASGLAKQLHTAGGQFSTKSGAGKWGEIEGWGHRTGFKGKSSRCIGRIGWEPRSCSFRCISSPGFMWLNELENIQTAETYEWILVVYYNIYCCMYHWGNSWCLIMIKFSDSLILTSGFDGLDYEALNWVWNKVQIEKHSIKTKKRSSVFLKLS